MEEIRTNQRLLLHRGEKLPSGETLSEKVAEEIFRVVEERYDKEDYFLGKGLTAEVYFYPVKGVCAKVIMKREMRKEGGFVTEVGPSQPHLSIRDEAEILDAAFNIDGVSVPMPYATQRTLILRELDGELQRTTVEIMLQEVIRGFSVKDLEEGRASLPEDFMTDKFLADLKEQISLMNEKVFHRDLHEGNVMISEEGKPFIIDFGGSANRGLLLEQENGTFVEQRHENGKVNEVVFPETIDLKHMEKIAGILQKHE